MSLADKQVAELYDFDVLVGPSPTTKYAEKNVKILENPYSLSDEGPESMFKQQGGRRRSRKVQRRKRKGTRRSRHH